MKATERLLHVAIEVACGLLVITEIVILFAGVVSRYVVNSPLVWSDELASILFLWLAMLGSVIALSRAAHMRLTALVAGLPPRRQAQAEILAAGAALLFLAVLLRPAFDYAQEQAAITTPALGLSDMVRAGAIPVGVALMLIDCALRLLRLRRHAPLAPVVLLGLVAGGLGLAAPELDGLGNWNLLIFFVAVLGLCVLSGIPIAFAFGLATVGYLGLATHIPLSIVVSRMDEGMSTLILLAVPLFVFLGLLIEMTGMAAAMVAFLASLVGHIRGGLCYVLLGAMYLVSGISGAKAADMAAVAPVLFPEMKRRGIHEGELIALLSASGAMSETIPPSLVLITVGSVTGVSIAALFAGGLLPALLLAILLALLARHRAGVEDTGARRRAAPGVVASSFVVALPALILPFVIRFAVVEGIATATEVSTIGIAYAGIVGLLLYRRFDWRRLPGMLIETSSLSGAILLIIGTATAMGWALTQSGFSRSLATVLEAAPGGQWEFLAASIAAFIVLGSVLEGIPAMVLFGPLMFPIARALRVNEVHYAMVVILAMGIGLFAPPFGVGYYAACAIGKVGPDAAMRRIWPYLAALLLGLIVVAAVPWISTGFLPPMR